MVTQVKGHISAGSLEDLKTAGCKVVTGGGHAIAVIYHDGQVHARGQPLSAHGVSAGPGQRQRWHSDLPLAPRPVRPGQRRHLQSLRR